MSSSRILKNIMGEAGRAVASGAALVGIDYLRTTYECASYGAAGMDTHFGRNVIGYLKPQYCNDLFDNLGDRIPQVFVLGALLGTVGKLALFKLIKAYDPEAFTEKQENSPSMRR